MMLITKYSLLVLFFKHYFTKINYLQTDSFKYPILKIHFQKAALLISFLFLFSACTNNQPSDSEARKVYEDSLGKSFKEQVVQIVSFDKTNGLAAEESGIKVYTFEYSAQLIYPNGLNPKCVDTSGRGRFKGWDCFLNLTQGQKPRSVGAIVNYTGEILFIKKEKGWEGKVLKNNEVNSSLNARAINSNNSASDNSFVHTNKNLATTPNFIQTAKNKLDGLFEVLFLKDGKAFSTEEIPSLSGKHISIHGFSTNGKIVVGSKRSSDGKMRAFKWENGQFTDLGTLGDRETIATTVSDDGSIVFGNTYIAGNEPRAFRWKGGKIEDISPNGTKFSSVYKASSDGKVAIGLTDTHAAYWSDSIIRDKTAFGSQYSSYLWLVSSDGSAVVGREQLKKNGLSIPFYWKNGVKTYFTSSKHSRLRFNPWGISANGKVVIGSGQYHAASWVNGDITSYQNVLKGKGSIATAVSADGSVIVGHIRNKNNLYKIFKLKNGEVEPISDLYEGPEYPEVLVSADGHTVVESRSLHNGSSPNGHIGFAWENGRTTKLGDIGNLRFISNDGQVIFSTKSNDNEISTHITSPVKVFGMSISIARTLYFITIAIILMLSLGLLGLKLLKLKQNQSRSIAANINNQSVFCTNCGNPQTVGYVFCTECGAKQET